MPKTTSRAIFQRLQVQAGRQALEDLQRLVGLLKTETDRRSRQVIVAEVVKMLAELEEQLKGKAS